MKVENKPKKRIVKKRLVIALTFFLLLCLTFILVLRKPKIAPVTQNHVTEDIYSTDYNRLGISADQNNIPTDLKNYPIVRWDKVEINRDGDDTDVKIQYPQFVGVGAPQKLNAYIGGIISKAVADAEKLQEKAFAAGKSGLEVSIGLYSQFSMVGVAKGILSMELVVSDYSGGGNGNHDNPILINWNLATDTFVSPAKYFCSFDSYKRLRPIAEKHIISDFEKDSTILTHPLPADIVAWVEEGVATMTSASLLLKSDGLIAVFSPYEVMSGSKGIVRTFIPTEELDGIFCF